MKVNAASIALACFAGNAFAAPAVGSSSIQNVQNNHAASVPSVNMGSLSKRDEDLVAQLKEALREHSDLTLRQTGASPQLTSLLSTVLNKVLDVLAKLLGECAATPAPLQRDLDAVEALREALNNIEIVELDTRDVSGSSDLLGGLDLQQILQRVINIIKALLGACDKNGSNTAAAGLNSLTSQIQNLPSLTLGSNPLLNLAPGALSSLGSSLGQIGTSSNPLGSGTAPDLLGLDGLLSGSGLPSLGLLGGATSGLGSTLGSLTGGSGLTNLIGGNPLSTALTGGLGGPGGLGGLGNPLASLTSGLGGGLLGGGLLGGSVLPGILKREDLEGEATQAPTLVQALTTVLGYAGSEGPVGNLVDRLLTLLGFGDKQQDTVARRSTLDSLIASENLVENGSLTAVGLLAVLVDMAQNGDASALEDLNKVSQ